MPTMPIIKPILGRISSSGMLNAMINDPNNPNLHTLAVQGRDVVENTVESIRAIGQVITQYAPMMNEVHNALVNRIGMEKLSRMIFNSPLKFAYRGLLEMGETVEEIFIGEAEPHQFDLENSVHNYMRRWNNDISSAFHTLNYHIIYTVTVDYQRLKRAFLSINGLDDYCDWIVESTRKSAENDEFMLIKYLTAMCLLEGKIKVITIPEINKNTASDVVTAVTETTNLFQFPSREYTIAGNKNTTPIDDLYILETAKANAYIKVNSLATAFNIDEVRFMGHVVMIDSLAVYDWDRMDKIFEKTGGYSRFTTEEIELLKTVQFVCMNKNFYQCYDNMRQMATPFINGDGLYTNYPYHVSQIISASPFQNVIAFSTATSGVVSITVSPATASVEKGKSIALTADVTTNGFGSSEVFWEISGNSSEGTYIGQDAILRIATDETATEITVKATSIADDTKVGSATITIPGSSARATKISK